MEAFKDTKFPLVIVGGAPLNVAQGATLGLVKTLNLVRDGWNGYNVLHFSAARMGSLMLGFTRPGGVSDLIDAKPKLVFFMGADEVNHAAFGDAFKVYVGHHGDNGAHHADVILPAASYAEKPGTYVNIEGRVQRGDRAVFPPGDAREDWAILRALSERLGKPLPFDSFDELRAKMFAAVPALGEEGLASFDWSVPSLAAQASGEVSYPIKDFYLTNSICRASSTMQRCSAELLHGEEFAEAAE
jgi:NADH-quinone oxidoreductase subunit G